MSVASRVTLGLAVTISSAIIGYVHYKQSEDRLKLHEGVIRDVEQQQRRKHENTYSLQQQIDMTKQLKKQLEASSPAQSQSQAQPVQVDVAQQQQPKSPATNLEANKEAPPSQRTDAV
ncbi:protein PET117 homolog, mitochondrial [Drosophila obscura]|uniref:protein PET117 homolog, mitochondrial n=1 Tax=Drosophila obscura TaxID=7282 RepID=UPI001BB0EB78|nr:protein PET117 homolog, mitochondrial [Drosophila obscura]